MADDSPRSLLDAGQYSVAVTRAWSLVQLRLKQVLGNPERTDGDFFVHLIDDAARASAGVAGWRDDLHRLRMKRNEVDKEGVAATRADAEQAVGVYEGIAKLTGGRPPASPKSPVRRRNDMTTPPTSSHTDEVVYFQGSPVLRAHLASTFLTLVLGVAIAASPFLYGFFTDAYPPTLVTVGLVLLGLLVIVLPVLFTRTIRYRITSYRIDYERGLFSKQFDTLELWHVDDIRFRQSLSDRMLNVGTITVMSDDRSTPELQVKGIPSAKTVYDALKDRVIAVKRQRGVIKMDAG
jgi:membrane protein YdbS with pleckstrin-like domain